MGKLFDLIGAAITSMGAVIFVLIMTITGMVFFSHTLFLQVFPSTMDAWEKSAATWVMAIAWESTVLITTVNTRHVSRIIPALMAVASGVIVLFFIRAFDPSLSALELAQRWFVGILAATINYIFADLFYAKWRERNSTLAMPRELAELRSTVADLQRKMNESASTLTQRDATINDLQSELKELRSIKKQFDRDRTCPYCNTVQDNPRALNAHKGHCDKNPKNLKQ